MQSVIAIVAGYLVFGVSSAILFRVSRQDPHLLPTPGFFVCSVVYGTAFATAGGYFTARLAPRRPLIHAAVVAALLGVGRSPPSSSNAAPAQSGRNCSFCCL